MVERKRERGLFKVMGEKHDPGPHLQIKLNTLLVIFALLMFIPLEVVVKTNMFFFASNCSADCQ